MTLIALVVAVTAGAQGTTIHEYPWNPDWDNDNYVGSSDLTGFLSAYGSEFGNAPDACDYDGSPLEELAIGIYDGSIILDSLFIEFELQDIVTYYHVGCPEQITDTVIFSNFAMLRTLYSNPSWWMINGFDNYGNDAWLTFEPQMGSGTYLWGTKFSSLTIFDWSTVAFGNHQCYTNPEPLPFTDDWYLDEEGIHIESGWDENDWPYYANYLHILPYWHYAE